MSEPKLPDDGLAGFGGLPVRRILLGVAISETVTLCLLLVNLAVGISADIAHVVGPVHGVLYLAGILITCTGPYRRSIKLASVVPVLGAWWAAATDPEPAPDQR